MNSYTLIDPLNLKGFIVSVTVFVKANSKQAELRTIDSFLQKLMSNINIDVDGKLRAEELWTRDLKRLFSGNISLSGISPLTKNICSGTLDNILKQNCSAIVNSLCDVPGFDVFFTDTAALISELFFSRDEVVELKRLANIGVKESYTEFVYRLIMHGFLSLENLPFFAAQRLYDEAQTYDYDQAARFHLLRVAADNGNRQAALEYGNYMNRTRPEGSVPEADAIEAFNYTLMALPLPSAIWNLAYQLECLQLSSAQIILLSSALRIDEKLDSPELILHKNELDIVSCEHVDEFAREAYILAYKIYFYLGYTGFSKGFNSLGKLLSVDRYGFTVISHNLFENKEILSNYYYKKAISAGNITAMQTIGIKNSKSIKIGLLSSAEDLSFTEQLLQTAAEYGMQRSGEALGLLYLEGFDDPQKAKVCFEKLARDNPSSVTLLQLGKLSPRREDKVDYFRRATNTGNAEAAYLYALSEYEAYITDSQPAHLFRAVNLIEQYRANMTDILKPKADILLAELNRTLGE